MTIEIAHDVGPAKIDIAYERLGDPGAPPVLLIMGGGAQLVSWPDELCEGLVARGLQVVRFDNRDTGQSTHVTGARDPDFAAAMAGDTASAAYTLADMAADTVGLLDKLEIASAHLVGLSLGGYIAQMIAYQHPRRVRSLISMSSTTGDMRVGMPAPDVLASLRSEPPQNRDEHAEQMVAIFRVIGSPGFPIEEERIRERARLAYDRGYDRLGMMRQSLATLATGDRTAMLRSIEAPTLVIHGDRDAMCNVSGGRATADAISCARLVIIEGLGHDLPRALWPRFIDEIGRHVDMAERARRSLTK